MKKFLFYFSILLIVVSTINYLNSAIFMSPLQSYRPDWFSDIAVLCFFLSIYILPLQYGLGMYYIIYNQYRKIGILLVVCFLLTLIHMYFIKEIQTRTLLNADKKSQVHAGIKAYLHFYNYRRLRYSIEKPNPARKYKVKNNSDFLTKYSIETSIL